jgi:hypothetical protein
MPQDTQPVVENLWTTAVTPDSYGSKEQYYEHLMEQYKIFVEMADRVSSRRSLANTFFLTLHTFMIGALGFAFQNQPQLANQWLLILPLMALLMLCYVWWRLLKSYRQLNQAKYQIIGEYERRLPSSPYWVAEWGLLDHGKNPARFKPLSDLEHWVPVFFALLYLFGALAILLSEAPLP